MTTVEDVTRCAAIRAAIDMGEDKATVLRAHGTSPDAWTAFEQSVVETIADQIDRGEVAFVDAFQHAYDAKVGERPRPPEAIIEDTAPAPRVQLAHAPPVAKPATPMQEETARLPVDPRAGAPLHVAPAAALPPNAHTVAPNRDVLEALLDRGALPFAGDARPPVATPARHVEQSGATMAPNADVLKSLLQGGAMPFGSQARPSAPPGAPTPMQAPPPQIHGAPTPMRAPAPQIHSHDMARTEQLPSGAEIEAAVALVKARQQEQRQAELASRATAAPRADAGKAPALPFGAQPQPLQQQAQQPQPTQGLMPLERYAEITATLEKEGNPMNTFQRIGATPESWMALVLTYSKLFARDRALEAQFEALMKKYRGKHGGHAR